MFSHGFNTIICRLSTLFEGDKVSDKNLEERQLKVMQKVAKYHSQGLIIRDLPCITSILRVAKEKIDAGNSAWIDALLSIVQLLGQPLTKLASSDELRSIENLCQMVIRVIRVIGFIFTV